MRKYIEFAKRYFQKSLVYRVSYFTNLFTRILFVYISVAIWSALYGNKAQVEGINLEEMITYAIVSIVLSVLFGIGIILEINHKVSTGEVAADLMKPMDFQLYWFFSALGVALFNILMIILPIAVISFLLFRVLPPHSFLLFFYFLISLSLGFLIIFSINFMVAMISFWTLRAWGFWIFKDTIVRFFAGAFVPLWFFPEKLKVVAQFLPFKLIYFLPLSIYLGKIPTQEILSALLEQLGWAIFFFIMGRVVLRVVIRKVTIQGG